MPRFYFHVFNGSGRTADDEGVDLQDEAAARRMAMDSIRSMVAEEALKGVLDLDGHIEIKGASGDPLTKIGFTEAFSLRLPVLDKNV
jgi:hypothetical protein